ncbi:hypothetical protein HPP92_021713 [Vanilla planifolia]|uniref:Uncharacterized protein n=1 Tax=Vanilla planifolia TaxID=51239 RepID=A0A835PZN2_VANPL|nr:hypothetical protein HPP92_021713 [Vanilla planifolia]
MKRVLRQIKEVMQLYMTFRGRKENSTRGGGIGWTRWHPAGGKKEMDGGGGARERPSIQSNECHQRKKRKSSRARQ